MLACRHLLSPDRHDNLPRGFQVIKACTDIPFRHLLKRLYLLAFAVEIQRNSTNSQKRLNSSPGVESAVNANSEHRSLRKTFRWTEESRL